MKLGGGGGYTIHRVGGQSFGVRLCLKILPQFSSHLNETCYTYTEE